MDVTLLGTGAADGWPNPFCRCDSCEAAHDAGDIRGQTSALVDGRLLLDCGPDTPRQAARARSGLADVDSVLVTHNHPDHFDPSFLLYRSWVAQAPLTIYGPPAVVEACRHWLPPRQPVTARPVRPGQQLKLPSGHLVRVLAGRHGAPGDTVLYDVHAPDGARLLYATDTAPLTANELEPMRDAAYDVVLLEETFGLRTDLSGDHLNLASFGATLAAMRAVGAVVRHTDVVAVHLSHFNPPGEELEARLAGVGARAVGDGTRLRRSGAR